MSCFDRRRCVRGALAAIGLAVVFGFSLSAVQADTYPSRTVRIVVPFPPGGAVDTTGRLIAPGLEKALGQPVLIDNKAGASGLVGTDQVAKASPDGYTLLKVASSHTVNSAVYAKLPYDAEKDLAPVVHVAQNSLIFVVNPKVKANTLAEFVALAKAEPGKLNYGSPGAASQPHVVTELFNLRAGIKVQHIPYRGGAPTAMATIAGDVQIALLAPQSALANIQGGQLRAIAVGSLKRDAQLPNVPTIAESGFADFEAIQWFGLFAPAGTPKDVIAWLNGEVNKLLRDPDLIAKLATHGVEPVGGTPEAFGALVLKEIRGWTEAARAANIKVD